MTHQPQQKTMLGKEECPSENVQWAIEHLNRYQEQAAAQAREEVLDDVAQYAQKHGGLYTINGFKGSVPCLSLHPLIVFINSLRGMKK